MQNFLKQLLNNPICINCGSYFVEDHLFCVKCFNLYLAPYLHLKTVAIDPATTHAFLINWVPGESDLISEMVYRFKSDQCVKAWGYYAKLLAEEIAEQMDLSEFHALVPLPGSKESSVHANIFAKCLSQHWQLPILGVLSKQSQDGPQKRKNAHERQISSVERLELFTKDDVSNLNLIYVDDILTTGSTYKRSRAALEHEGKSLVITLFCRPKAL